MNKTLKRLDPSLRVAITGGTSGLGLALAKAWRERGAQVAFVARDAERVARTARSLPGTHGIHGDVARKLDTHVLAHAQEGVYSLDHTQAIAPDRLRRFFLKGEGASEGLIKAKKDLKDRVQFQQLNLIADTWPMRGPFDVIFCRNVLIYFDQATQRRILERMAALLCKDGYLMLGHAESMHSFDRLFRPVGHSIYQARTGRST